MPNRIGYEENEAINRQIKAAIVMILLFFALLLIIVIMILAFGCERGFHGTRCNEYVIKVFRVFRMLATYLDQCR